MSTATTDAPSSEIAARLAGLRESAKTDVEAAAAAAWAWIEELKELAGIGPRHGAEAQLDELFALGSRPEGP